MAITLGLVEAIDSNGVYVSMPGSRGVLRGPYKALSTVAAGTTVLVASTDDGEQVMVGPVGGGHGKLNVLAFGARGDGVTDDTAAIQEVVDFASDAGGGHVLIPGTAVYRIDGTIRIPSHVTVEIPAGAICRRISSLSASTTPLFQITGQQSSRLVGDGRIETQNDSPDGVVILGPIDLTEHMLVSSAIVSGLWLQGVKQTGNVAVRLSSSNVATSGLTWQNVVSSVRIDGFGTGVYVSDVANANEFVAIEFTDILDYCFDFYGNGSSDSCSENLVLGGFVHGSTDVTGIRMRNGLYNQVIGMRMEPGGTGALGFDLDANSTGNHLLVICNTYLGWTDAGTDNTFISNNETKIPRVMAGNTGGRVGFFGTTPIAKPTVTGSRGGNAALQSLLTQLANLGLITDSSS